MSTPTRRTRSPCWARAASGQTAAPPRNVMNWRRLISSIGFLRTELSKLGRSQPLCARLKGYHPEGAAGRLLHRLLHCGISAPSADGFMAEMGHKHRISVLLGPPLCRKWRQYLPKLVHCSEDHQVPITAITSAYSMTSSARSNRRWGNAGKGE